LRLPNFENAVIDPEKLRDYLLSPSHPVGRFKATFFSSLGYTQENWTQLEADFRHQHLTRDALLRQETRYGTKYEIRARIKGPAGRTAQLVSVWIILVDENLPRFITAHPGGRSWDLRP
jgi:hypothetical protein